MADALVERRPAARFFCHRCNIEFEDVLQDYTCPYCASGFIEQLENDAEAPASGDDFSDADMSNIDEMSTIDEMSNLDDSDDTHQSTPPMLNDLAFLLSGGRLRTARRTPITQQLVWMIGDTRGGGGGGAAAAGAPFVFVGAPGDYVFGGEGLDAVVTQLLGQLENTGPPPLPREQIMAIPNEQVTPDHPAVNTSCSVCWETFHAGDTISRLECSHMFHVSCITPWLQLHATCPICRRSLLPPAAPAAPAPPADVAPQTRTDTSTTSLPRVVLRRLVRRRARGSSSSSSSSSGSQPPPAAPPAAPPAHSDSSTSSSTSLDSTDPDRFYTMDIDFD